MVDRNAQTLCRQTQRRTEEMKVIKQQIKDLKKQVEELKEQKGD